ncbi:MAG: aminotransferase class I/II-fold pyridoxal phosphate-dependent enzyme [Candidatus Binatia bacterium]|nr:aminotransferase class I/II-fold pyridoxal phosphate-dependent enzyme [Candidatus Binatia bacterium]
MARHSLSVTYPYALPSEELQLSPIKAIEIEAAHIPGVVSLAQGIPSFDTPEIIKSYVKQKLDEGACAKYSLSPGLPALRELISEHLRSEGMQYDPESEIIVTCGSIEAITASLLALVPSGSEVIVTSPTYTSYSSAIRLAGAVPRFVPLVEDLGFDLDHEMLLRAFTRKTRAVLIAQPNNPTGTIFPKSTVELLLQLAERHGAVVISDEVYKEFVYSPEPVVSPAAFAAHRHHTVRVCSFSKAYAMTGWRVGFLHTDRRLAQRILRVHDTLVTCAPVVSQYAAMAALEHSDAIVVPFREQFRLRRQRMIEHLDSLSAVFDYQKPDASYFVFPRVKDSAPYARDSHALACALLYEARVAVVPGSAFGPSGEGHLRLCFARDPADIDLAFERMRDFFKLPRRSPSAAAHRVVLAPAKSSPVRVSWRRQFAAAVFSQLARLSLRMHRPIVIGIAGGRGKTVAKRVFLEILSRRFQVRVNPLSYNTEIGLPLAVLGVQFETLQTRAVLKGSLVALYRALSPERSAVLVLEYGVRQSGDAQRLLDIVEPDILVLTPTAGAGAYDEHSSATLRDELATLVRCVAQKPAPIIACQDDPFCRSLDLPKGTWFVSSEADTASGCAVTASVEGTEIPLGRDFVGTSELYAQRAALVVARVLGTPLQDLYSLAAGDHDR